MRQPARLTLERTRLARSLAASGQDEGPFSPSMLLTRQALALRPNCARVVLRPFQPATELQGLKRADRRRANHIVDRVLGLDSSTADGLLADVLENFQGRHRNLVARFEARANDIEEVFAAHSALGRTQRQLVGAFFMNEYSFESAALFNPSIVAHPDQSGVPSGALRFILSLRAVGEGHLSSITFRSGSVAADGTVSVDPTASTACIAQSRQPSRAGVVADYIDVVFRSDEDISERVIFPITASQSNGIEDARFVEFNENGRRTYYATYTAYSGNAIRSELVETTDFKSCRMTPLKGSAARNKGMALFPRKFDGRYALIGRQDNESLYLIYSEDLYSWEEGVALLAPRFPWEFVQIGNCGSPIELDEGWLLLTHGVGPMRRYSIGAVLLDKTDPSKILGRCAEPLLDAARSTCTIPPTCCFAISILMRAMSPPTCAYYLPFVFKATALMRI